MIAEAVAQLLLGNVARARAASHELSEDHARVEVFVQMAAGYRLFPQRRAAVYRWQWRLGGRNDCGFEQVFARQLTGKLTGKDMFLCFTNSGNSPNILAALRVCRARGVVSLAFSGHDGGETAVLATHCIAVPGETTSVIQELHILLAYSLCEAVERAMFPWKTVT